MNITLNKITNLLNCLVISFCFILNSTNNSTFLIFLLLFILLCINLYEKNTINKFKIPLFFVLTLCLPFSFFDNFIFSQLVRFIELLILIQLFPNKFKISPLFVKFLFLILFFLVFTQFAMTLNISIITKLVDKIYPVEINYWGSNDYENVSEAFSQLNNRLAGIYYNPNLMGQSVLLLYVLILISILKDNISKVKIQFILFIICLISIVLSGSRTALITFIFVNVYAYHKTLLKYIYFVIPFLFYFIFFVFNNYLDEVRVFSNITNPFGDKEDSGGAKLEVLINHFKNYNYYSINEILFLLFGKMNWDKQFDADPGYIISYFGLVGTFFLIFYISLLYFKIEPKLKFVFFIFLISIGATVIMNFRFSILAFYILSFSYKSQKKII